MIVIDGIAAERYGVLPQSGGLHAQDAGYIDKMGYLVDVYRAYLADTAARKRPGYADWRKSHVGITQTIKTVERLLRND